MGWWKVSLELMILSALVTGTRGAIGGKTVSSLGVNLHVVLQSHTNREGPRTAVETVEASGQAVLTVQATSCDSDDSTTMFDQVLAAVGSIDAHGTDAGRLHQPDLESATWDRIRKTIGLNTDAARDCVQTIFRDVYKRPGVDRHCQRGGRR